MPLWLLTISLFVIGFLFILLEAFVIPGFGLGGVLGFVSMGTACFIAFTRLSPLLGWITTLAGILLVIACLKFFPRTSAWRRLRLDQSESAGEGFQSADPALAQLVNKSGVTLSMLRPSGIARINGQRYDVVSDSEFIDKDVAVIVTKVAGNNIIVQRRAL